MAKEASEMLSVRCHVFGLALKIISEICMNLQGSQRQIHVSFSSDCTEDGPPEA